MYDLHLVQDMSTSATVNVVAPHVDPVELGKTTGHVPAQSLMNLGIKYALLNHSEHRVAWDVIVATLASAKAVGLNVIVCCENLEEAKALLPLEPYAISFEDKELIGSGNSITTGRAEDVKAFLELVKGKVKAIVGAGITNGPDIKAGREMQAEGYLLASAFAKATDKKTLAIELASAALGLTE